MGAAPAPGDRGMMGHGPAVGQMDHGSMMGQMGQGMMGNPQMQGQMQAMGQNCPCCKAMAENRDQQQRR